MTSHTAEEAAKICGVSERTIYRLRHNNEPLSKIPRIGRPPIFIDDFNKTALQRLILGFYKKLVLPTLDLILHESREIHGFPEISRTSLYRLITKLGFVCKRRNRKIHVYQRLDVVISRQNYLRNIKYYRESNYQIFYQDESFCNKNHTKEFTWQLEQQTKTLIQDGSANGGLNVPSGAGRRLILNQLGSELGFLQRCGECFIGTKKTSDYHCEMNSQHFEEWWEKMVLPDLPEKAVVVIDRATYHSRLTDESKKPT